MSKIKLDVIKPWIQDKITEILKIDDDVVVDFVYNQLDEKVNIFFIYTPDRCFLYNYFFL